MNTRNNRAGSPSPRARRAFGAALVAGALVGSSALAADKHWNTGTGLWGLAANWSDANLDGTVNLADFNRLAANFGEADKVWSQADFNFDGVVSLHDFNLLAATFGLGAAGPEVTAQDWSRLGAAVPEPVSLPLFGVAAWGAASARRRRAARR